MSFLAMDDAAYIDGLIGIYELNNTALLREIYVGSYLASAEKYRVLRAEVDVPAKAALAHRETVREAVRFCVLKARRFDSDGVLALIKAQGVPEADQEADIMYAHQQFKGLHEGNAIRFRLKAADLDGVDLS